MDRNSLKKRSIGENKDVRPESGKVDSGRESVCSRLDYAAGMRFFLLFLLLTLIWSSQASADFSPYAKDIYSQRISLLSDPTKSEPDQFHYSRFQPTPLPVNLFGFPGAVELKVRPTFKPKPPSHWRPGEGRPPASEAQKLFRAMMNPADSSRNIYVRKDKRAERVEAFFRQSDEAGFVMSLNTPLGRFSAGRMVGTEGGLVSMGYGESRFGDRRVFCDVSPRDTVMFSIRRGSLTFAAAYEKIADEEYAAENSDSRVDEFWIMPQYEYYGMDFNIGVNLRLAYNRDRSGELSIKSSFSNPATTPGPDYARAGMTPSRLSEYGDLESVSFVYGGRTDIFDFWPAAVLEIGPFEFHSSIRYRTGKATPANAAGSQFTEIELEGLGIYADAVLNSYFGRLGVGWLYLSGDETEKNSRFTPSGSGRTTKLTNMVTTGAGYTPLLVAYDYGIEDADLYDSANHWSVVAWWDKSLTEEVMLHAAYGYIKVNQAPDNVKRDYGHEIDSGITAKLSGSAVFTTTFGYFIPGQYFKRFNREEKMDDAYVWKNELEIRF